MPPAAGMPTMTAPHVDAREARLDRLRNALLEATNTLNTAKAKALRHRERFVGASTADSRKRLKHELENTLGELRAATLEFEAARTNFRREIDGPSRVALDEIMARLERIQDRYAEVSKLYEEAGDAYEASKAKYEKERAALELKAKIPGKFDGLLQALEGAIFARDKAFAQSQRAHRRSLVALEAALLASDEFEKKATPSNKLRRTSAGARARDAYLAAERATGEMAIALARWFDAEKQFALAASALEATRGAPRVLALQLRAQEMLRDAMRFNWASLITDEALAKLVKTLGELKSLR